MGPCERFLRFARAVLAGVIAAAGPGCGSSVVDGSGTDEDGRPPAPELFWVSCPEGMAPVASGENATCIDVTEVTNEAYAAWLATDPVPPPYVPAPCPNVIQAPSEWPPAAADLRRPMVDVTWCDARTFCHDAGKRLCGAGSRLGITVLRAPQRGMV